MTIANQYRDDVLLLDFHASWCGPCKNIAPFLDELRHQYSDPLRCRRLVLVKIDVDEDGNQDLMDMYSVKAMPTFVWIIGLRVLETLQGADREAVAAITSKLCTTGRMGGSSF
jgi:thiol-disulfide isomerase/thioredoxin